MPKNNTVTLTGNLADEPYFEVLARGKSGETQYIRFDLLVERDVSQGGEPPAGSDGQDGSGKKSKRRADLVRVVMYGIPAWCAYFYLKQGARVSVSGWVQTRKYFDKALKHERRVTEINAQEITYGRGCDFERGDRQRKSILEQLREKGPTGEYEAAALELTAELEVA